MIRLMGEVKKRSKTAVLTDEHREESAKLKELYQRAGHKLSQAAFGAEYGIGNQGAVWQCLNGIGMPISLKAARGFATGLNCSIADFSPRLAKEAELNAKFTHSEKLSVNGLMAELAPLIEDAPEDVKLALKRIVQTYQADPVDGENKAKAIIALLGPGPN